MSHIITPNEVEATIKSITGYYENSPATHNEKLAVLSALRDHYKYHNFSDLEILFASACESEIRRHSKQTNEAPFGIEK